MILLYECGFNNNSLNFIFLKLPRGPHFAAVGLWEDFFDAVRRTQVEIWQSGRIHLKYKYGTK
jgi:hypothetical protein